MKIPFLTTVSLLPLCISAAVHGEGDEGTIMGPVAFLWPDDRPWSAAYDNTGPCGSSTSTPTNRTEFPLTQGEVALSIADDAWKVAFYISFDDGKYSIPGKTQENIADLRQSFVDPDAQSEFTEQVVENVTEIEPGHQCYKIDAIPSSVSAGSNATIQLAYWSNYEDENNGKNETFYACADIYFVETTDFSLQVPCFNVTADTFETTATGTSAVVTATASSSSSGGSGGLTKGAIAGIAVGTIVGSLAVVGVVAFMLLKKRKSGAGSAIPMQDGVAKRSGDGGSIASTH